MAEGGSDQYSRWWYGIVLGGSVQFVGLVVLIAAEVVSYLNPPSEGITADGPLAFIALMASFIGLIVFLFFFMLATWPFFAPVVAFSMAMDANKLRKQNAPWRPNPYLWFVFGLFPIVAEQTAIRVLPWTVLTALTYLVVRYVRVGLFSAVRE